MKMFENHCFKVQRVKVCRCLVKEKTFVNLEPGQSTTKQDRGRLDFLGAEGPGPGSED